MLQKLTNSLKNGTNHNFSMSFKNTNQNEMKKISTLKRKAIAQPSSTPTTISKLDCLDGKINAFCKNDQVIYESGIFSTVPFSVIQNYLRSIKKFTLFKARCTLNEQFANTNEEKAKLFNLHLLIKLYFQHTGNKMT